jgi:acetolactate synthase-1/2/3 large subunit
MLPVVVELLGAAKPVLQRLSNCRARSAEDWGEVRVAEHLRKYPRLEHATSGADSMTPQEVLRILRKRLPRDGVLTTDVGSHKIFSCLEWPAFTPNRFLVSNGLSSMGYGLPAAIAASLVLPDTPVVSLTGDAGLLMSLGELNTLASLKASVTVLVMKDHALDLIRSHQKRSGKQPFGTEFSAPDFVKIAEAHGIPARCVSHQEAFDEALQWSLDVSGPTLIEAEIDPSTYPTTPQEHA